MRKADRLVSRQLHREIKKDKNNPQAVARAARSVEGILGEEAVHNLILFTEILK
jgi:hypothetical protein